MTRWESQANRQSLLAIYAHPADESFVIAGTLLKYSAAGIKTALICATCDTIDAQRSGLIFNPKRALQTACDILRVDDLSVLDYRSGELVHADALEVIGHLVYHIRRLQPQVVVTFEESGIRGNPDHAAIHRLAVSAFFRANDLAWYPEQMQEGLRPYQPQKLYVHVLGSLRSNPPSTGFVERGAQPVLRITLDDDHLDIKLAAIRAYQNEPKAAVILNEAVREALRVEGFKALEPRSARIEEDLFDGVAFEEWD